MQAVYWVQDEMESNGGPWLSQARRNGWPGTLAISTRISRLYGDPLLEPEIDPFPDGYLEKLARAGLNGVWMQCVLSNMAPSKLFPEFGARADERIAILNKLIQRARLAGLKVFLYINEPRSSPRNSSPNARKFAARESRGLYRHVHLTSAGAPMDVR